MDTAGKCRCDKGDKDDGRYKDGVIANCVSIRELSRGRAKRTTKEPTETTARQTRVETLVTSLPMRLFSRPRQLRDKKTGDNDNCPIEEECERICARARSKWSTAVESKRRCCTNVEETPVEELREERVDQSASEFATEIALVDYEH